MSSSNHSLQYLQNFYNYGTNHVAWTFWSSDNKLLYYYLCGTHMRFHGNIFSYYKNIWRGGLTNRTIFSMLTTSILLWVCVRYSETFSKFKEKKTKLLVVFVLFLLICSMFSLGENDYKFMKLNLSSQSDFLSEFSYHVYDYILHLCGYFPLISYISIDFLLTNSLFIFILMKIV